MDDFDDRLDCRKFPTGQDDMSRYTSSEGDSCCSANSADTGTGDENFVVSGDGKVSRGLGNLLFRSFT